MNFLSKTAIGLFFVATFDVALAQSSTNSVNLFPTAASAPTLDRSVSIHMPDKTMIKLTSVRFPPAHGQSDNINTYFCGVIVSTPGVANQGVIVIGVGETQEVSCDHLKAAGLLPARGTSPRIGLIFQTESPNTVVASPAVLIETAKTWSLDEPDTITADNLPGDLTIAAMRAALK
jgi:hypothetical protein